MGGAVGEALAVCHRGQVVQGRAGTGGRWWHGSMSRWAARVATNQAGVRFSYRHDGSEPGLAIEGLGMNGQPNSSQRIILVTGFSLYYWH